MQNIQYKKGEIIEVTIDKIVLGGQGIGRINNLVVFVWNAIPGEVVKAKIIKIKKNFLEAEKTEILREAINKIEPKCSLFSVCGGCKYQNVPYETQLEWKETHIKESLERIGGFKDLEMMKIIPSPKHFFYRNKIELTVGLGEDGETEIGFHKFRDYKTTLSLSECALFDERLPEILNMFRNYIKNEKLNYFDLKDNPDGLLQYIVMRKSEFDGSLQINIITRKGELSNTNKLVKDLTKIESKLSLFQTINFGGSGYSHHGDKKLIKITGEDYLIEKLENLKFKISPFSFFQTNTLGAEKLYQAVRDFADLNGNERIVDLYCGTGTIGQFLAKKAKEVYGIELIEEAIVSAIENCKINNIKNCQYIHGDTKKILKFNRDDLMNFDLIITDPPRSGMVPKALRRMIDLKAKHIIYVSCNPARLAVDLKEICASGYVIEKIQPVDMFPHTAHVETVVKLKIEN